MNTPEISIIILSGKKGYSSFSKEGFSFLKKLVSKVLKTIDCHIKIKKGYFENL